MRTLVRSGAWCLIGLLCVELGFRLVYHWKYSVPVADPSQMIFHYYPGVKALTEVRVDRDDEFVDVLLLGGSVLHANYSSVASRLAAELQSLTPGAVRIHNMAAAAHSLLDSRIKYELVRGKPYDLAIVYHGINDVRANNCPPEVFRADYSHYSWYREVQTIRRHPELRYTVLPFAADHIFGIVKRRLLGDRVIPTHNPRRDWVRYGGDLKAAMAFERRLHYIARGLLSAGTPVVLATFAHQIPQCPDQPGGPGAGLRNPCYPTTILGKPEHVDQGVHAHNAAIAKVAKTLKDERLHFVGMNALLGERPEYFEDACHFTEEGSAAFVSYLRPVLEEIFVAPLAPPRERR